MDHLDHKRSCDTRRLAIGHQKREDDHNVDFLVFCPSFSIVDSKTIKHTQDPPSLIQQDKAEIPCVRD